MSELTLNVYISINFTATALKFQDFSEIILPLLAGKILNNY